MVRAVVFDFDGVILNSNPVKRRAFFDAVESRFPGHEQEIAVLLDEARPSTRAVLMMRISRVLARQGVIRASEVSTVADDLVARYGERVDYGLMRAPFVLGAKESLAALSTRIPLFLNTQNPRTQIFPILERRGLACYFSEVYGSEKSKTVNLALIMGKRFAPTETVVIGDGILDWQSARNHSVPFVAVNVNELDMTAYPPAARVSDLTTLPDIIASL